MKRKLLFLTFLLFSLTSFGQENWETTFNAGINCSFLSHNASSSSNKIYFGATGGLEQTYYFDNSIFSVQSGLEYDYIGAGNSTISVTAGNGDPSNGTLSGSNANYLSIPMHLKCQINDRWGATAGASYRFGISSRQWGSYAGRDDISVDAGFFYRWNKLRFNLLYQHGLRDVNPGYQLVRLKNRTFTFSVSTPLWNF